MKTTIKVLSILALFFISYGANAQTNDPQTGAKAVMAGSTYTYSLDGANPNGKVTWLWTVTGDVTGFDIATPTASSTKINWKKPGTYTVKMVETIEYAAGLKCNNVTETVFTVEVKDNDNEYSFATVTPICASDLVNANAGAGYDFEVKLDGSKIEYAGKISYSLTTDDAGKDYIVENAIVTGDSFKINLRGYKVNDGDDFKNIVLTINNLEDKYGVKINPVGGVNTITLKVNRNPISRGIIHD